MSIGGQGNRYAGIVGLRFVKAIARVMRNGRIVARFAQTIFSMSLEMSVLNQISITVLAWMFHRPCAITWGWRRPTSPTGSLSKFVMCLQAHGEATAKTTTSLLRVVKTSNEWQIAALAPQRSKRQDAGLTAWR